LGVVFQLPGSDPGSIVAWRFWNSGGTCDTKCAATEPIVARKPVEDAVDEVGC
jgi:hypothetical protein